MTKSKSSISSSVSPSIFVRHLGAPFLNDTCAAGAAVTVILPFTRM